MKFKRKKFAVKIYGNWCGPGHSGPKNPRDALDKACWRHDICYDTHGWGSVDCDVALCLDIDLKLKSHAFPKLKQKLVARLIRFVFMLRPRVAYRVWKERLKRK